MPDEPISALVQIAAPTGSPPYPTAFTNPTTGAMLEILDTTNTSMATTGTNSKIAPGDMIKGYLAAGSNITLTETAGVVTVASTASASPGGSSGQIQTNNGSGGFGALAVPLGVASGGTGLGTLTAHAVVIGAATSTPAFATIGTSGRVLIDQGASSDPSFNALSGDVTVTNTGATTVGKIGGTAVSLPISVANGGTGLGTLTAHAVVIGEGTSTPGFATIGTAGRVLIDQGVSADPSFKALSGDVTIVSTGATTIAASAVTLAKQANFAASSIMGNPTGSPAAPSAITLGANLSFSGTTLVATAGGGMTNPMTTTGDIIYSTTTASPGAPGRLAIGSTGNVLTVAGGIPSWAAPATSGTVTSVGLSTNAGWLTVGSSPVTSSGTITLNATTAQAANNVLATPDGTTGVVGLRALVNGDMPAPGSSGQLVYNSSNLFAGAANLNVGSSGQLNCNPMSAPGTPATGDLWYDSARNTFGFLSAGMVTQPSGIIWQGLSSGTAVTNTASATTLLGSISSTIGSLTIPANALQPGKIIRPMLWGSCSWPSGPPTVAFAMLLGGNVVWGSTALAVAQTTTATYWTISNYIGAHGLQVQSIGASGKIIGSLGFVVSSAASALAMTTGSSSSLPASNIYVAPVAQTINTTGTLAIDFQVKMGSAVAAASVQFLGGWIEILG